jgi:hypothetical protein
MNGRFRIDETDPQTHGRPLRSYKKRSIWLERLDESGEPTEDYIEVDEELFQLSVENNHVEGEG